MLDFGSEEMCDDEINYVSGGAIGTTGRRSLIPLGGGDVHTSK